jgi:hypothetical protein
MDARHKPHNPRWIRPPGNEVFGRYPVSSVTGSRRRVLFLFFFTTALATGVTLFPRERQNRQRWLGWQLQLRTRPSGDTRLLARVRQDSLPCACDARPRLRGVPHGPPTLAAVEYMRRSWPPSVASSSTQVCGCARRSRAHLRGAGPPCLQCTALGARSCRRNTWWGGRPPPPPPLHTPPTPTPTHAPHTRGLWGGGREAGRAAPRALRA